MHVEFFDVIQTIDSIELAKLVNKFAEKKGKNTASLNTGKTFRRRDKTWVLKENLLDLIKAVAEMKNIKLDGLMTMPPFFDDPERTRPLF